jgi:hypothetical protein
MANDLTGKVLYIDTFSSAIDLADTYQRGIEVISIEWVGPTSTDHYAQVRENGATGPIVFEKYCAVVKESYEKEYHGGYFFARGLYIPVAAGNLFASGKLIITTKGSKSI